MERKPSIKHKTAEDSSGRLWKIFSKIGLGLFVIVLALTMMQCSVKSPKAPEWDSSLVVPILNRTYTMQELIEKADQDGLVVDSLDNIIYSMNYEIDTISVSGDNLSVPNVSYSVSEVLGPIKIDPPVIPQVATNISDISVLSLAIPGPLPSANFTVENGLPTITNFNSATINTGTMRVIVSNQLGVNLDALNITIYDIINSTSIGNHTFVGGIGIGETDTAIFILDGKTLSNTLRFIANCHNQSATLLSASDKKLTCTTEFDSDLTVSSAVAQVPALSPVSFSQEANLGSDGDLDIIESAELSSGTMNLSIRNNTALDATMIISLPDLDSSGTSFSVTHLVGAGENAIINRSVENYLLIPTDQTLPQAININVSANMAGSGESFVTVSNTNEFSVEASLTGLVFESVTGVFESTDATFDPVVEKLDIPEGFDGFALVTTIIEFEIENSVELPGYVDLTLSNGAGKTLLIQDSVQAASADANITTTITIIDSTFLSPLPDSIIFSGSASFGDGTNSGTISANDHIVASIRITAPIEAVISETTIDTDIEVETIDQTDIENITDHISEARFIYRITNHLPIGASIEILFGGDTTTLAGQNNQVIPEYTIGSNGELTIEAAPTIGGIVPVDSVSTAGQQQIVISSSDLSFLENDPLFIGTIITLAGSDGQVIKLNSNDYITITGYLEVDYHVDDNF